MFQREPGFKTLRPSGYAAAINLRQRRTWYEGDPAPTPDPAPVPDTPPAPNGGNTGATFTQADVDRIVGERAKRAQQAAIADLLKELGLDSADTLKAKVKAAADQEAAQLTELEKAQKRIADLEQKAQAAETKAAEAARLALEKERNSAIREALKEAKNPQKVLTILLADHAADVQAVMGDDGALDAKKIGDLVAKAKKDYPEDFQTSSPGSPPLSGGRNPQPDTKSILDQLPRTRL